jgi:hypothetical protein
LIGRRRSRTPVVSPSGVVLRGGGALTSYSSGRTPAGHASAYSYIAARRCAPLSANVRGHAAVSRQLMDDPLAFTVALVGFIFVVWLCFATYAFALRLMWWQRFGRRGKCALFVYSDNPKWIHCVEERLLPCLSAQVVVVNSSTPGSNRYANALLPRIHRHWTDWKAHTPVAIVFLSFWKVRSVRFYKSVTKASYGNTVSLENRIKKLESLLGEAESAP